ncbi:hypothetical protein TSOC_011740, partial [Tetrabaena socialis]
MSNNKVVPTSQNGGGGIKHMAIKLFGSVTDQAFGGREQASLVEPEPAPPSMLPQAHSSDYLEEIAEIQQLLASQAFRTAQEEDPAFTILHYVALLGRTTLAEAIERSTGDVMRRFARMARYLVRRGHEVYVIDKYGCIPLQIAVSCGSTEMVSALLEPFDGVSSRQELRRRAEYLNHQDTQPSMTMHPGRQPAARRPVAALHWRVAAARQAPPAAAARLVQRFGSAAGATSGPAAALLTALQIRFTALHGAVSRGQHGTAILLLEAGGNPQILDITRSNAFQ